MAKEKNDKKTIFFSYSFIDTKVVDEIDKDFQGFPGITIKRCVRDIGYTDSIKEFMNKVRDTDFVFIVISDAFIKSPNCMYEVNELFKEKNFKERILPIVPYEGGDVKRAKIFTANDRVQYVKYWKKQRDYLEKEISELGNEGTAKQNDDLKKYREISNIVGDFIDTVSDMNYVPLDKLKSDGYKQILKKMGYEEIDNEYKLLLISTIEDKEKRDIELDKFILNNPKYFGGYFHKGFIAVEEGKYMTGVYYYTKTIEMNTDLVEAYNNRRIAYEYLNKYDEAIDDCAIAIELKPDDATAYFNRGTLYGRDLKKYDKAIEDYTKAIELQPYYADAYNNRGIIYKNLKKYNEAILDYTKVIKLSSDSADAYNNRGITYSILKLIDKAISDYTKAIELKPDYIDAYYNRGSAYDYLKDHDKAIADYTKAIELKPDLAEAYHNRGLAYYYLKQYDKAIADYTKAIELMPNYANAFTGRGLAYEKLKKYDDAIKDWKKAIELNSPDKEK